MSALKRTWARVVSLFQRDVLDREFDEEARSHLEFAVDDYVHRGMSEADARRLAHQKFGAVGAARDAHRDSRGLAWLDEIVYDLRFALRGLRRDWTFSLTAIAMLAVAIGLNVTVYTVVDAILFRGLPLVTRSDRIVYLQERCPTGDCSISYPDFEEWRTQARTFDGMAFIGSSTIAFRDGDGRPIDTRITTVSANAFGLLGVAPMLGRDFAPADEQTGAPPVVVLNHRVWASRFAARADAVGSIVHVNGVPATVIGVMPERFDLPLPIEDDMWMPIVRTPELLRRETTSGGFTAVGRLRDGVSVRQAREDLEAINRRLEALYPTTNRHRVPTVVTHSEFNSGRDATLIWGSLWTAAWFVLVIAGVNLTNLSLVRTMKRWRELSTRMALGAGEARMIRQMIMESLAVTIVAGALGWWIAAWCVRTWIAVTVSRYQVLDYTVDRGTFVYLVVISLAAAALSAVAPIARIVRLGAGGALNGDARGVTQSLRGKHLAARLVAGQMALAIVLLSGAGVLIRSFAAIVGADTGVRDPEHVLIGSMRLPSDTYPNPAARRAYFDRAEATLKTTFGIAEESVASTVPAKFAELRPLEIEGRSASSEGDMPVSFLRVGASYFRVVGASATSGRDFTEGDRATSLPVAIVNQSFAARFWPGEQPIGKRLRDVNRNQPGEWRTVVGVVPNIMQADPLRQQFKPIVYVPFPQEPPVSRRAYFLLRIAAPPEQMAGAVRAAVQQLDPDVQLEDFQTLKASFAFDRDFMDAEHSELGKHSKVAPVFALIALLLAAIGLYAVIAYSVSQRTKEIGVRMAIGAASRDIRGLILGEGMRPVSFGLLAGLVASLGVNRVLQSQLVGVSPYDPVTLMVAPVILIAVALLACYVPARRALSVDPAIALRHE